MDFSGIMKFVDKVLSIFRSTSTREARLKKVRKDLAAIEVKKKQQAALDAARAEAAKAKIDEIRRNPNAPPPARLRDLAARDNKKRGDVQ